MKLNGIMCVMAGFLLLSQPSNLFAMEGLVPSGCESTVEKDGFLGRVKSVKIFDMTPVGEISKSKTPRYIFRYDSLGRRTECQDLSKHLLYKNGYDKRGKRVRASVVADTMKERISDTIFVYDKKGRMSGKRISSWGELLESEQYEYDSLDHLLSRKIYSEVGGRKLKHSELFKYDKAGRLVVVAEYDEHATPIRKYTTSYDGKTGKMKKEREESNGVCVKNITYHYDALGRLVEKTDDAAMSSRVQSIKYDYNHRGLLKKERMYDEKKMKVGENLYSHRLSGKLKKTEVVKMRLTPLNDSMMVNLWDRKVSQYNRKGVVKKYQHFAGKGQLYMVYDEVFRILLPDGTVAYAEDYDNPRFRREHHITDLTNYKIINTMEPFYLKDNVAIDMFKKRFKRDGNCKKEVSHDLSRDYAPVVTFFIYKHKKLVQIKKYTGNNVVEYSGFSYDKYSNILTDMGTDGVNNAKYYVYEYWE